MRRWVLLPVFIALALGCASVAPLSDEEAELFWLLASERSGLQYQYEAICHVHGNETKATEVPVFAGMYLPSKGYMKARVRRFPSSFLAVWGETCEGPIGYSVVRWVCEDCRRDEEAYGSRHKD